MGGTGHRVVACGRLWWARSHYTVLELCATCGRGAKNRELTVWGRPSIERLRRRLEAALRLPGSLALEDANGDLGIYVWSALAGEVPVG